MRKSSTRPILPNFIKSLPGMRKYLGAYMSYLLFLEICYNL